MPPPNEESSIAALDAARNHVNANVVPCVPGRKCVDGRYFPTQAPGMTARPGADFGYALALLAVSRSRGWPLDPEACFQRVYDAVTRAGDRLFMHTDHHADPVADRPRPAPATPGPSPFIGCRHVEGTVRGDRAAAYGVDGHDVRGLVHRARALFRAGAPLDLVTVEGGHHERGVLIVRGAARTVLPRDGDRMYFVYDVDRDDAFMAALVARLSLPWLTLAELEDAANRQTDATFDVLAARLPIFAVAFDGETPLVSLLGVTWRDGRVAALR